MSETTAQFQDRIERAVSKFLHHAAGEGLDATELDGDVVLRFRDGALVEVLMPKPALTGKAKRKYDPAFYTGVEDHDSSMPSPDEGADDTE
jgi:hypothetical protein